MSFEYAREAAGGRIQTEQEEYSERAFLVTRQRGKERQAVGVALLNWRPLNHRHCSVLVELVVV